MNEIQREVCEAIDDRRDDMVEFLADLVSRKSTPGNERVGQELMIERFEGMGLEPDVWDADVDALRDHPGFFETTPYLEYGYEDRPNVAAVREGSGDGRSLALSGHIDVVPVGDEDDWEYDPWDPTIEDGRMYGRGTNDMKSGIAAIVGAAEALDDVGVELDGDFVLQTTIEEEAGGVGGVLSALERGYQPDGAIVTEPSGVPTIGVASAGVMYFRVTVEGRAAHTATKFLGRDAVGPALKIYEALEELDRARKERISFEPAVDQFPEAEGNVTNLAISSFQAGEWTSTVPPEAVMEWRIGWPPGETTEEVKAEVLETIDEVVENDEWLSAHPPEIEWFGWHTDPHELDRESEIVEIAAGHAEEITGGERGWRGGLGGNDERFYNRYYDIPCPSVGARGANSHGADEWVELDSLVDVAQTLALTAMDWCGYDESSTHD